MATKAVNFFKNETILCVSAILAIFSMFFTVPSSEYIKYIDFRTLSLLFCLMAVIAGFAKLGLFDFTAEFLVNKIHSPRTLCAMLVFLCFFSSMFITNDVALITFVPFTITLFHIAHLEHHLIGVISLQTIAANLGSMLTPMGNPQNLYLYSISNINFFDFISILLPYTLLSFLILAVCCLLIPFEKSETLSISSHQHTIEHNSKKLAIYTALFLLSILSVAQILPYTVLLAIILIVCVLFDKDVFKNIDFSLLFTFVFFFIFIGNIKNIPAVNSFLQNMILGREFLFGVMASQVFSNVPAAVMLAGFTPDRTDILLGVDIGGLGTLIASMANLISYRFYARAEHSHAGRYLLVFTLISLVFLALNSLLYVIIG